MDENLQWHPAFCYAMRLELREEDGLSFEDEFELTEKPLRIDLMIVKKGKDVTINNKIGRIFKTHNIVEYKSPLDGMNINTFYKTIAYACLYIVSPKHTESVDAEDVTITLLRSSKPVKLLKVLKDNGYEVISVHRGIYYIKGSLFDMQIIVSSELSEKENKWISSLCTNISYDLYISLYDEKDNKLDEREKEMAANVMQVVTSANAESINKWKESEGMVCQALRDIMKPEIEQWMKEAESEGLRKGMLEGINKGMLEGRLEGRLEGEREGEIKGAIKTYFKCGKTPEEIAELTDCSLEYVNEVLSKI